MNRAEQFYRLMHQALGLTVQEQQRAQAERQTQLAEVVR